MVAAKLDQLDQSRVLVTNFRQNRLTLKGRSAGQRHTDTKSHTDRQTRLKIMALQVCNRANKQRSDSIGRTVLQTVTQELFTHVAAPQLKDKSFQIFGALTENALTATTIV